MNCPVCLRESTPVKKGETDGYKLLLCPECGVIYSDPMRSPGASWYEESEAYSAGRVITKTPQWYHRAVLKMLPRGSLLDIGCGTGIFLGEAKKLGFDVWGVDFDKNNIDIARSRYGIKNAFCYSVSELKKNLGGRRFDVVTFFEVLEHLDTPMDFIEDVKGLVRPGGLIALSVPNRERFLDTLGAGDAPPNHLTKWNSAALRKFLSDCGLEAVEVMEKPLDSEEVKNYLKGTIRFGIAHSLVKKGMSSGGGGDIKTASFLMLIKDTVFNAVSIIPGMVLRLFRLKGGGLVCTARVK